MRKIGIPAVRLALAGRMLQRLSMVDRQQELERVTRHIRANASLYGTRELSWIPEADHNSYADHVIGLAGSLPIDGYENQLKVRLSSYLAMLIGADAPRINALLHLTLAALDRPIRDLATLVALGIPSHRRIHAIPFEGLAMLMEGDESEPVPNHALMVGDVYIGTRVIEAVHLCRSTHHSTGTVLLNEHPVCRVGDIDYPANAIKLDDRIVAALAGRWHEKPNLLPAEEQGDATDEASLAMVAHGGKGALQIAFRSNQPAHTAIDLAQRIQGLGQDVNLVNEMEENSVIIALIATQVHACLLKIRNRPLPVSVVPDLWSLVGANLYHSAEPSLAPNGVAEQTAQYDTELMSYQKDLLRILSGEIMSPIVWVIEQGAPISEGLVGMFSQISNAPEIDMDQRAGAIQEMARLNGLDLDEAVCRRIAVYTPYPHELAGAFRAAAVAGKPEDVEALCRNVLRGSGLDRPVPATDKAGFDLRLVEAQITMADPETGEVIRDNTLERAIRLFVTKRDRPIKILLHGQPGTSKTTLAHHIANRMGMEVLEVRPSTIFDRWVGSSEQKIRDVFAKAAASRQFILIDEVDTFLSARGGNQAAWEKSSTNEWLIQMQQHMLPMACTTNHYDLLDPAAVRRFLFKIEVKPLDASRARIAWTDLLGLHPDDCPPTIDLEGLTVADFALVSEKMTILDTRSAKFARQSLNEERSSRHRQTNGRIGFFN